jgi:hypothetical protein
MLVLLLTSVSMMAQGSSPKIQVFREPTCGCCSKWVEHLGQAGFPTTSTEVTNMDAIKTKYRVPASARSCHTAVVSGYFIEGHVPASDVRRLLKERPKDVIGLAVPGMPIGSPGMEVSGVKPRPFDVHAYDANGKSRVFARH